jgi:hypothetical protein
MPAVIVDTNVAVVANRSAQQASSDCVITCVRRLQYVMTDNERLVLDGSWKILNEYKTHLRSEGQPGIGDAFLKWVLTNWTNPHRCDLVTINQTGHDQTIFDEFPADPDLVGFDPSDRKFVAVARAHPENPTILQAVDSGWWRFRDALHNNHVAVDFICESHIRLLADA